MKFLSDCEGECCVCVCGDCCLAGHGDNDFGEATIKQVVKRLDNGRYSYYKQYMIDWLHGKGYEYVENTEGKK